MRKEFGELRSSQIEKRLEFIKTLQDLYDASQVYCKDRTQLKNEMFKTEDQIVKYSNELKMLEKTFRKRDQLLTKYIQSLKEKAKESKIDSYWELNPALITETEFEEKLKEELLFQVKKLYFGEELLEKENMINQYFIQGEEREKKLHYLKTLEIKITKEIAELENSYKNKCALFKSLKEEIIIDSSRYEDILYNRENIINSRVENRNNGLPTYLRKYTAEEYDVYLKVNKNLIKQVNKNIGSKTFKSMNSFERETFINLVIDDHSIKKNKYFDLINSLIAHDAKYDECKLKTEELKKSVFRSEEDLYILTKELNYLREEIELLKKSIDDLKNKTEITLKDQIYELQADKKDLQIKYNVNYYMFKIKELGEKLDELKTRLDNFQKEYDDFMQEKNKIIEDLNKEDIDIKNELIELGVNKGFMITGGEEENSNELLKAKMKKTGKSKNMKKEMNRKNSFASHTTKKTTSSKRRVSTTGNLVKRSLIGKNKSIDFAKTLAKLEDEDDNKEVTTVFDDINVYDSRNPPKVEEIIEVKEDPFFISSVKKIMTLINGLIIYKKVGKSSKHFFDMLNSEKSPPEKCGYVLRQCLINVRTENIEIKRNNLLEHRISFKDLKGMMLSNYAKALIRYIKSGEKPSLFCCAEPEKLIRCKFIPIQLILDNATVEFIMPSYQTFISFYEAYEELLKLKNKAKRILRYLEKSGKIDSETIEFY